METITFTTSNGTTGTKNFKTKAKAADWMFAQGQITIVKIIHTDRFGHRDADTTPEAYKAEIDEVFALGADGPRFCATPYVGLTRCDRKSGHDGEHRTTGATGRIIGWDN